MSVVHESDALTRVVHPTIPYAADIPKTVFPGFAILVRGIVKNDEHKRFNIDLTCGRLVHGDHRDDVCLHFNPRFDAKSGWPFNKPDQQIVLNSLRNNVWEMEERCTNTLEIGKPFTLRILMLRDYYKLTLNGKHLTDFVHRIPIESIRCIYIAGGVDIEEIEYQGSSTTPSAPTPNSSGDFKPKDYFKPSIPFVHGLGDRGFLPPREIRVTATPRMNASRFECNLMSGTEFLLHFRVDMPTSKTPQGFVVRNSTKNNEWLAEERNIPYFPFKTGHTFDCVLLARNDNCEINVDGRTICVFRYRPNLNPKGATSFTILGDVMLQSVHLF